MPLHAITVLHGEDGLRDRLLLGNGRLPAGERGRVDAALALMSRLHGRDRRQREAYSCHPLRVTVRILSHYRVADADVACAALLHDTVEDHAADIAPGGSRQDALAVLAGQFDGRAAGLVAAVTNPAWEPGRDRHEQYRGHVAESLEASPWARAEDHDGDDDFDGGLADVTLADGRYEVIPSLCRNLGVRVRWDRRTRAGGLDE